MKITLRNTKESELRDCNLRFGNGVKAGEFVASQGRDILIGTAGLEDETYEDSLSSGLAGALQSARAKGEKAVSVDVVSFAPEGDPCDYFANVILDALCAWRQAAGDPDLDVCLACDLQADGGILARVEQALEKPVILRQNQAFSSQEGTVERRVARYLKEHPAEKPFRERLNDIISAKYDGKGSIVYRRAGVSRSVYSKTMSPSHDYLPSKPTISALVIGLKLELDEAQSLFHAAGYHLGEVELQDRIVRFFLEEKIYNIHDVNSCLYEYRLPLLGEHMRDVSVSSNEE